MSIYSLQKQSIRNIVKNALTEYPLTDGKIIYSHQNGTVPQGTYITINITFTDQEGRTEQSGVLDEAGLIHYLTPYRMRVNFQTTGSQAGDIAHSLYQRIGNSQLNRDYSNYSDPVLNLSVLQKSSITRNPFKIDTTWIEYFSFSVDFYFISHFSESVQAVESVVVEDVNNSITFTIPPT